MEIKYKDDAKGICILYNYTVQQRRPRPFKRQRQLEPTRLLPNNSNEQATYTTGAASQCQRPATPPRVGFGVGVGVRAAGLALVAAYGPP